MSITVVTSVTKGKDHLIETHKKDGAKFVAFTDKPMKSKLWDVKPAYDRFTDPRRNSRIHKILIHQYVDTEYSIWVDGNIELLMSPQELVDTFMKDHDIMFFEHIGRKCLYEEAVECAVRKLDDPETIIAQAKTYEDAGFVKDKGLYVGNFIIRRHTPKVEAFNNAWWSEYCRHSVRDQISLPYVIDKVGIRVNHPRVDWEMAPNKLTGQRANYIKIYPHIIKNPTR